ncbi:MAG: hypothetical protein H5T83_13170 [Actinotalea sp.]|nr:hypothetical protein [Actinotalea sp.]
MTARRPEATHDPSCTVRSHDTSTVRSHDTGTVRSHEAGTVRSHDAVSTVPLLQRYVLVAAARLARRLGPGVTASVVHRAGGRQTVVGAAPPALAPVLALPGPVGHALVSGSVVVVPDVASEDRWTAWRAAAQGQHVAAALAAPGRASSRSVLVVAALSTRPRRWTAIEIMAADSAVQEVARAVQLCDGLLTLAPAELRRSGEAARLVDAAVRALLGPGVDVLQALRELRRSVADHDGDLASACAAARSGPPVVPIA